MPRLLRGMTAGTPSHAALCRPRKSWRALCRQPPQHRLHGGRGDREAPQHRSVPPALPGRGGGRPDRRRARAAAAAGHVHERVRTRGRRRPRISTSSASTSITVFHDEIELRARQGRVKVGGGIAGHNGLRSISEHIGNDYRRVRIGVGHPGVKDLVHAHVLNDFAKAERPWVEALCDVMADNAELLAKGQDASFQNKVHLAHGGQGLLRRQGAERAQDARRIEGAERQSTRDIDGLQMRHRRPAECRQVDALQRADRNGGGAGGELSVLHHRAECRRGRGAGSAARPAGEARASRSRSCRRGSPSSTSPGWCAARRRARGSATSSWPISARSTPSPMWCAASRTTTSPMSRTGSIRSPISRRSRPS